MRFVGIDLGTQSLKVVVTDERFAILHEASAAYPTLRDAPDAAEQDPRAWDAALRACCARVPLDGVAAIAISGQLDGCVAVDASGDPIGRALIWQDARAEHFGPKLRLVPPGARYHEPTTYLLERLTGEALIDPSLASTTLLYDLATGAWSPDRLARYGVVASAIPAIRSATSFVALSARGAAITGLPIGTPVAVGTGDDFATPLGAGIVAPGTVICTLGTAEVVGALSETFVIDPAPRPLVDTHAYPAGGFFVENPGWLSGGALRWAGDLLGLPDDAALDALAASVDDAAGVIFVPGLAGPMTLHGLTAHHTRAHLARAVLEGLAFACRDVVERLAELGLRTDDVTVLGGGGRSQIWTQMRADVLQRTHRVADSPNSCAIGAAMIAAVAAGALPDLVAAAGRIAPASQIVTPRVNRDAAYARYRRLVETLAPLWI